MLNICRNVFCLCLPHSTGWEGEGGGQRSRLGGKHYVSLAGRQALYQSGWEASIMSVRLEGWSVRWVAPDRSLKTIPSLKGAGGDLARCQAPIPDSCKESESVVGTP